MSLKNSLARILRREPVECPGCGYGTSYSKACRQTAHRSQDLVSSNVVWSYQTLMTIVRVCLTRCQVHKSHLLAPIESVERVVSPSIYPLSQGSTSPEDASATPEAFPSVRWPAAMKPSMGHPGGLIGNKRR